MKLRGILIEEGGELKRKTTARRKTATPGLRRLSDGFLKKLVETCAVVDIVHSTRVTTHGVITDFDDHVIEVRFMGGVTQWSRNQIVGISTKAK